MVVMVEIGEIGGVDPIRYGGCGPRNVFKI